MDIEQKYRLEKLEEAFDTSKLYGLEIEVENHQTSLPSNAKEWNLVPDGSLRDSGVEAVFRRPLPLEESLTAIQKLERWLPTHSASHRCSVHVHMNVRPFTTERLENLYKLWWVFESALFSVSGKERFYNIYCPHTSQVPQILRIVKDFIRDGDGLLKYYSLSNYRIQDLGTVEVRSHKGCVNSEDIATWLLLLDKLYVAAENILAEDLLDMPCRDAASVVFGDMLPDLALENMELYWDNTTNNVRLYNII